MENKFERVKAYIKYLIKYYDDGVMMSMSESIHGKAICEDILKEIQKIELEAATTINNKTSLNHIKNNNGNKLSQAKIRKVRIERRRHYD